MKCDEIDEIDSDAMDEEDHVHDCSNCERLLHMIRQYDVDFEESQEENRELKERINILNQAENELGTDNRTLTHALHENKILLKKQTERMELLKDANLYRNEVTRLEKVIVGNKEEMKQLHNEISSLKKNTQYFMDENTRLKNAAKVITTETMQQASGEELEDFNERVLAFVEISKKGFLLS